MKPQQLVEEIERFCAGFAAGAAAEDKNMLRSLFSPARAYILEKNQDFISRYAGKLLAYIASGEEINPYHLEPEIVPVKTKRESQLFRFASLSWSIPVSPGYGRRMRFLVLDRSNGKLIGILGLCDPVFNLRCRDEWIGWDVRQKEERLSSVMNAYVLGAVPPYSYLLGGKLVALLALSNEVRAEFRNRYEGRVTVIRKKVHNGRLALITVTSALGRSSLYNRLRAEGRTYYVKLGRTLGWGHHHLSYNGLYHELHKVLEEASDPILKCHRYGNGPNWKFRLIRQALRIIGLPEDLLRHGLQRETYAAALASNALEFLRGEADDLEEYDWPAAELFAVFRRRWLLGRAERDERWRRFQPEEFLRLVEFE